MATTSQILHWNQQQDTQQAQKKLKQQLKIDGANMLREIYEAILHIRDYAEKLKQAILDSHPQCHLFNDDDDEDDGDGFKITLREDCPPLTHFCKCMERILLFGFKKKFFQFRASSLWSLICEASNRALTLTECDQLQTDLNLIQSIDVLNDDGKMRAFLRQSLRSKSVSLYFKLLLEQTDVIHDYYWDFGVMNNPAQATALLAQLDELSYLPKFVEFQMLCADKALNIVQNFQTDEYGVPQWQVKKDEGDISMMVDVWLLHNRERLGIDLKIGHKKVKKEKLKKHKNGKKTKSKRKLNALKSTDELRLKGNDSETPELDLDINTNTQNGTPAELGESTSKKKRKKKKEKEKKKKEKSQKKKKEKSLDSHSLYKQLDRDTVVIDNQQEIQNILETEKLQRHQRHPNTTTSFTPSSIPGTPQSPSPSKSNELNIDDIIDEHLEKEENRKRDQQRMAHIQSMLASVPKPAIQRPLWTRAPTAVPLSRSQPVSPDIKPRPGIRASTPQAHEYVRTAQPFRRSSFDGLPAAAAAPISKASNKPNRNIIKGTSAITHRPFEFIVIQKQQHQRRYRTDARAVISSTPPPLQLRQQRNLRKHANRRDLNSASASTRVSQSSSPMISAHTNVVRNVLNEQTTKQSLEDRNALRYKQNSTVSSGARVSQSSSPAIRRLNASYANTLPSLTLAESRKPRSSSLDIDVRVSAAQRQSPQPAAASYVKPKLSRKAKMFMTESTGGGARVDTESQSHVDAADNPQEEHGAAEPNDDDDDGEEEKEDDADAKEEAIVIEHKENRSNDEYDTDEDTQTSSCYQPQPFRSAVTYLTTSEAVRSTDSDNDNDSTHFRARQRRDEQLHQAAMALDRGQQPSSSVADNVEFRVHAHYDKHDSDYNPAAAAAAYADHHHNDNDNGNADESEHEHDDNMVMNVPPPTDPQYRFSNFMTSQFQRKQARIASEDLTFNVSITNSLRSNLSQKSISEKSEDRDRDELFEQAMLSKMANLAHEQLQHEGAQAREQVKSSNWRNGLEISFTTQKLPPRDDTHLLIQQNLHCATCGLVLKSSFLRRAKYHYCRYTGLLHCHQCHKSERAVIPWRVLHNLDCRPTPVCCSAKLYLDQMYSIPCITLDMFAKSDKVQQNKKIIQLHKVCFELRQINKYVQVCPYKKHLFEEIYDEYKHWIKHSDVLSLRDCVNIISFNTGEKLQTLSNKLQKHVKEDCDMCRGKGYFCEICKDPQVIYPFQYQAVEQCEVCKACFHAECWLKVNENCPRCQRRQKVIK